MSVDAAMIINRAAAVIEEKEGKPRVRNRVIPELLTYQQLQKVRGGLTPQEVSRRMSEADMGRMWLLCDLINSLRQKDSHLQGILETREQAVQQLEWDLELPKNATAKEEEAREFTKDVLQNVVGKAIAHCSSSPLFGYSVTEQVWRRSGQFMVIDRYEPIAHRRFEIQNSRIIWNDSLGQAGVDILDEYPSQFVISRPRVNGDVPAREGLMRVLCWAALFRNWTLTDWLRLGEIAWRPWRTAQYDRKAYAQQEEVDELVNTIEAMTQSGLAVFSDAVKFEAHWPQGQSGDGTPHKDLFGTMGREMSKAALGQTETTESSSSSGHAQSKIHYEVKKDKREADARFIAADVTRDSVSWIVLLNYGAEVRPSRFKFITEETAELEPFGKGVKALKDAGMRIPAKWAHDKTGIPEPVEGEEVIGENDDEAADGNKKPKTPENEHGDEEDDAPDPQEDDEA